MRPHSQISWPYSYEIGPLQNNLTRVCCFIYSTVSGWGKTSLQRHEMSNTKLMTKQHCSTRKKMCIMNDKCIMNLKSRYFANFMVKQFSSQLFLHIQSVLLCQEQNILFWWSIQLEPRCGVCVHIFVSLIDKYYIWAVEPHATQIRTKTFVTQLGISALFGRVFTGINTHKHQEKIITSHQAIQVRDNTEILAIFVWNNH